MTWVLSSTTTCATTLDAKAARAAEPVGPAVVDLSMSSSHRSMRRETAASGGMSSVLKSLKALDTGSSLVIGILSLNIVRWGHAGTPSRRALCQTGQPTRTPCLWHQGLRPCWAAGRASSKLDTCRPFWVSIEITARGYPVRRPALSYCWFVLASSFALASSRRSGNSTPIWSERQGRHEQAAGTAPGERQAQMCRAP